MPRTRIPIVITALLIALLASACIAEVPTEAPEAEPAVTTTADEEEEVKEFEDFDYDNFADPTTIDNQWLPLIPGSQWTYEGVTNEDDEEIPHQVIATVTDLTKEIDGIRTVVIWDQDFADGELVETELAFFAQDNDGNVWRMGEYPEEWEDGEFVEAPAWIAGQEEARAGIAMKATPDEPGSLSYAQGWGPAVDWTDRAQTYAVGEETCVPFDCFEDVLIMDEFSQEEPNAFQQKYYAPGVGNVQVGWRGDDPTQEVLELVAFVQLSAEEMDEVRASALELEERAYEINEAYGQTPPIEAP